MKTFFSSGIVFGLVAVTALSTARPLGAASSPAVVAQATSESSLKTALTAKDLIGAAVFDSNGEKLGVIKDLVLGAFLSEPTTAAVRTHQPRDESHSGEAVKAEERQLVLGVGGALGVAEKLVTVPADALNYDNEHARFMLSIARSDFMAFLEKTGPATTKDVASNPHAPDVSKIRDALRNDHEVAENAANIDVILVGEQVVLSGKAKDTWQRSRIIQLARNATDLVVIDSIQVAMN